MKPFAILGFIVLSTTALAQKQSYKGLPSLIWPKLYDIRFVKAVDPSEADKPVFSDAAKAINGKIVTLPGYIVPFTSGLKSTHFMLSSLPLNACFFCGVGGPETVVEVFSTSPVQFTEKPVEVQGTLRLNEHDPDKMIYILEKAEYLGEVEF
jgi:hypothetical protein